MLISTRACCIARSRSPLTKAIKATKTMDSKYLPAKPGALGCEPLKAADGAADAAPDRVGHLKVAIRATD